MDQSSSRAPPTPRDNDDRFSQQRAGLSNSLAAPGRRESQQHGAAAAINANNGGGGDSPESGSLYSDEIPSGYNSGEQYDTLSTGYMSGEAYELPETRMDLHEPALDVIDECNSPTLPDLRPGQQMANDDDDGQSSDIFSPPTAIANAIDQLPADNVSDNSTSTDSNEDATSYRNAAASETAAAVVHASPNYVPGGGTGSVGGSIGGGSVKSKLRKKVTTFAIPIENTPLTGQGLSINDAYDIESSDAGGPGAGAPSGGYRAVPSDTDTSALDSDAAAMGAANASDSGADLLHASRHGKIARLSTRKAKKMRKHDEQWFAEHDNKYWSWTRFVCFWGSMLLMAVSIVVAAAMIYAMPRTCDPPLEWYQGKVAMDLRPGYDAALRRHAIDVRAEIARLPSLKQMGVKTLHLKDIAAKHKTPPEAEPLEYHPTQDYEAVYGQVFVGQTNVSALIKAAHENNMTVMVHVPVIGKGNERETGTISVDLEHAVTRVIVHWAELGVDGVFLDGLEHFAGDAFVADALSHWDAQFSKFAVTPNKRILMASYLFIHNLQEERNADAEAAMRHIGLLDARLDLSLGSGNVSALSQSIADISAWDATEGRPWINWNLQSPPSTHAALAFQLLLPGTITVRDDSRPRALQNLTDIRAVAVPIFMNGNYRRCGDCEEGFVKESNFVVSKPVADIVQFERFYSRRNRYVLVANFGDAAASLEEVGNIYSTGELLLDTSESVGVAEGEQIEVGEHSLPPGHALVIKLPR